MKNITQLVFKPKKSAAAKGVARPGTIWFDNDDQDEIDALSTLAIKKAGFKRSDFFKPVRVDHLVVDDMPAEGVFDTAFCDRYKLAKDGKSWLLPAAQSESGDSDTTDTSNQGQGNEDATSITDSGDTAGSADTTADASTESTVTETVDGEELPAYVYNVNGEPLADVEKSMLHPVATLSERHRILSQFILEDKFSHQITPEQLAEVSHLELDVSDNYIQDMLLATRNAPAIHKLNTPDLWKYTDSFKKVFARDKRHPLSRMINFNQAYADAHPIDRGLLVQEWIKGNYISRVEKAGATSVSVSAAPEPQKTSATKADVAASDKPATKTTYKAIDIRIGRALAKGAVTYPITARDVEQGKAIVEANGEEFKRWSATYRITENIQFYDEKTHIEMIRQAPREVVTGSPELRRAYVDNYLSAYGTLDPDQMVYMPKRAPVDHKENMERVRKAGKNLRDMAAGRFNCDEEKPQSEDVLADKPSAPETVEPDANEHHPDTRSMATESSVTADSDKTMHEKVSEQLAADRGDFVPGISDPSDPKWVHNDYSASSEGEKTEVDTDSATDIADSADHSEEFSNQTEPEASHSEPSADQNEPESPETELKSLQPEPVTKVADGVFDVSAFFADTSNQGEKTEVTPPNNDDRSHECAEEKTTDAPATTESLLHEIVRLQSINNQLLEEVISGQQREVRWKEDVMDSLFAGIRGFARTFTVRGMRTKGRDNGEKLHKSEKG
ncbi:hypothetical protein DKF85_14420 [Salmonella enterica]|nr:hypothetical protein [Salmonella enterica]EEM9455709.1 hypothetical protein [Salmonella enterica]